MEPIKPAELVSFLRRPGLRVRTGIWLMSSHMIGHESNEGARLGVIVVDLRSLLLDSLPEGAQFVPLDADRVLQLLNTVSYRKDQGDCVLVYNLDLLLARLTYQQRVDFWQFTFTGFAYRPCALLLGMPATASSLLPAGETLNYWKQGKRLAVSPEASHLGEFYAVNSSPRCN
jgi:hypothetical protein